MNYKVEFKTSTELPHWELSHIINVLGNLYMKLTMLDEMQKLYDNGAEDKDFIIGSKSIDLHTNINELNTLVQLPTEFEYSILDRKSNNANSFWGTFNNLQRPIIMYKTSNGYKSLYNYENYLTFQEIRTNSPQRLKALGKNALVVLATIVIENVSGHYIDEFLFKDKITIEQNEKIQEQNEKIQEQNEKIQEQNEKIQEQNEKFLENQELMILYKPIKNYEIDLMHKNAEQINNIIQNFKEDTKIEYYDFIKFQKAKLENKLKYQLERTPLNIENILIA